MTKKLIQLISEVVELLLACGHSQRAKWFSDIQSSLKDTSIANEELYEMLDKLDSILGGMGSFSDIPLTPTVDSMTIQQARDLQWGLAGKIGQEIKSIKEQKGLV